MAKKTVTVENKKSNRFKKILELIDKEIIGTQGDLSKRLKEEGFDVTQATLSRDIHELGLVKVPTGDGERRYKAPKKSADHHDKFHALYQSVVNNIDSALNQVVITCDTGTANAVCASFDNMNFEGVLGTIAGDDTILIITKSEAVAKKLAQELRER